MKRLNIEVHKKIMENIKIQAAKDDVSIRLFVTRAILVELAKRKEDVSL